MAMYDIVICIYAAWVAIASLFDSKVRKMWRGEHETFDVLKRKVDPAVRYVWFHAASLGEFEQGRPLMERLRREHPDYKILLTFFSPSGYEVRKDYDVADIVCYLPLDTRFNAIRFLRLVNPVMAFFIKYEFWYNYLRILKHRGVPVYSVSSIFRPKQVFFRWYARSYARVLKCITHFYVQNEESRQLLATIGIVNVTITGDTRFDRVLEIKNLSKRLPILEAFAQGHKVFVAGSSWPPDGEVLSPFFNEHKEWRLVVAPHKIDEARLQHIEHALNRTTVRYTKATPAEVAKADCLIIDCFGLLSSIYHYCDVAYVGGGFGAGIHNVLEAAVWGVPVMFGPNNKHFMEAQELMEVGGGFEVTGCDNFCRTMEDFMSDADRLRRAGENAGAYVAGRAGASARILADVGL